MSQLAALLGDGGIEDDPPQPNQLALVAADAPLLPPSARLLSSRLKAGVTRRQGCGVCRSCLFFPNRLACLATKSATQLAAKATVKQATATKRSHARALERQLEKKQAVSVPTRADASVLPQQACRLCKCADHTAVACPLHMRLSAAAPVEATWADTLDPHLRAVLLAGTACSLVRRCESDARCRFPVQQLASARAYSRCRSSKPYRNRFGALRPEHLRRVADALCRLRQDDA